MKGERETATEIEGRMGKETTTKIDIVTKAETRTETNAETKTDSIQNCRQKCDKDRQIN